jgi:SpoVK/Ycf46/Vps4 family AAA+-type ATPase
MIKLNGVVLNIKSCDDLSIFASAIPQTFRIIERDTPLIVVIEDIEGLCNENNRSETTLLNILDGNLQIDNCIYIGCTNFPEKLKERILNRPSRFDKRYYIGLPNREVRKFYLKSKIKQNDLESINLDELVDKTEGLSLAHLGELIKSVFIFKKNIEETLQELFDMREFITSTKFENKSRIGFRNNEIPKLLENEEVDRSENELPHCR